MMPRPPGQPLLISVVVPTRNRAHLLSRLLAALEAQDYSRVELIVVDDASDDATESILRAWQGERRCAVRLETPSGSYAARNAGWKAAHGAIIAFTDDDCLPDPGWLSALACAMQAPDSVGAQGVTLAGPGVITPFTHQIEQRRPGPPYRTCNIAYRRSILEHLGGFDDRLRWYADNIFGLYARREGRIAFAPDAIVHHPPRPRQWRDRAAWRARFEADTAHRQELHRLRAESIGVPGAVLPIVLWMLRPLLKQSSAHVQYLIHHPSDYLQQIGPMMREKRELLLALREAWSERRFAARARKSPNLPPLPEQPLISIVVATRDRPQLLQEALAALDQQTWQPREVVVVDNGGDERVEAIAEEHGATHVSAAGLPLAAARQAGVDAAHGAIVAFTDDDCLPHPTWLATLATAFRRQPFLAGVQGRTRAEPGPIGSRSIRVARRNQLYQTCNIAYRADVLRAAGGLDLHFYGWFEDAALGARVLQHGPIGFEPAALVIHRSMPRRPMDRRRWQLLLADELRLSRRYAAFYRQTRGPGFLPTVIARWLVGSPLKTLLRELPHALADPHAYLALIRLLLQERRELLAALMPFRLAPPFQGPRKVQIAEQKSEEATSPPLPSPAPRVGDEGASR